MQRILGFSPIEAGLAFLPVTAGILLGSVTAQVGVKRFGARANTLIGMVIAAAGLFLLAGIPVEGGSYWSDLLPGLVLMAFGMGNTFVPITLIATSGVDPTTRASRPASSTRPSRWAARSGSPCSPRWRRTRPPATCRASSHRPVPAEVSAGLVEGYQVAFLAAAILVSVGAIMLALFLRPRDVVDVSASRPGPTCSGRRCVRG